MELVKKNIHMNKLKCRSNVQLTLDDDFNVPDVKPDIGKIIKEQGEIRIQEMKPMNGKLMVKGNLAFNVLYVSDDDVRPVHNIAGEIPFDEIVNMDAACQDDNIAVKWELEDLNASLINSRKISVKSIVSFTFTAEDVCDEETAVMIEGAKNIQQLNKKIDITQIAVNKKDTFRVKDEITLTSNKPNIYEILYSDVSLRNVDVRLMDDKISLKGELALFVLYSGEDENNPIEYIDMDIPFSGVVECNGCSDEMIGDIIVSVQKKDLEVKPDSDGEERVLDIETILGMDIKVYEDQQLDILSDLYSTCKNVVPSVKEACYENLIMKNNTKARVVDRMRVEANQPNILQICSSSGTVKIDEERMVDDGIEVEGVIDVHILYITEDDAMPLNNLKGSIPFTQLIEVKGINEDCSYSIRPNLEQISVMMLDGEEIEVKACVELCTMVFQKRMENIIKDVSVEDLDLKKVQDMPSLIGYAVKAEDTLWNIAKKYYTTIESIKEINDIDRESLVPGEKILIIKEIGSV